MSDDWKKGISFKDVIELNYIKLDTRYGLNDAVHQDFVEGDDFLSPELRNATNKLTKLRNLIGDENFKAIDGVRSRDKEADAHWEMVNDWLNNALIKETYPSKETLLVANKLWKKYNGN